MTKAIQDQNRRDLNLSESKIKDVLPEYFLDDNEKLVTFLEKYYEFLDSEVSGGFKSEINNLFAIRDIGQTSLDNLDQLINEIGNGLQVASFFQQPRLMARLLASFYRSKGTLLSAEGFFRAFFNEEVTVEYPKDQIFIVNESEIGFESQKFIQDDELYQVFSILIKVGLSVADYETLYKRFVHPAGFHFAGQVQLEEEASLFDSAGTGVDSDEIRGLGETDPLIISASSLFTDTPFTELTGLLESDGQDLRIGVNQLINVYKDLTGEELNRIYENVVQILTPNSFTFDDDSDGSSRPDTSVTVERVDNSMFTRYTSDSAI